MASSQASIPYTYKLVLTILEPIFALGGVCSLLTNPAYYLSYCAPRILNASSEVMTPLYLQILGGWLILIFNDLVTLRVVFPDDVKVWKCVLAAHLCSDLVYTAALGVGVGWQKALDPRLWDPMDWITMVTTLPALVLKVTFLMGIGVPVVGTEGKGGRKKVK